MKWIRTLALTLLAASLSAQAANDFLPVREAFQLETQWVNGKVEASWKIKEGYYLYKDRLNISSDSATLGDVSKPAGKVKFDEAFNKELEIYRNSVSISAPAEATGEFTVTVKYQGCADAGLCYPPEKETFTLSAQASGNQQDKLSQAFFGNQDNAFSTADSDLLAEDLAFQFSAEAIDNKTIAATWRVADGYYLYKESIKFAFDDSTAKIASVNFSPSEPKQDEKFGLTQVFYGEAQAVIQLSQPLAGKLTLKAEYQGCAEIGVCYPVMKRDYPISFPGGAANSAAAEKPFDYGFDETLDSGNVFLIIGVFFVAGLLLSFTACVYPMIPILSGIIAGEGKQISTKRAFILSVTYVESAALAYALIGVIVAATGEAGSIQTKFQNPWLVSAVSALFVVLALSMFEVFHLRLPHWFTAKVHEISDRQKGGTLIGVAIMGMLSVFIISACSAPALVAALTYIQNSGDLFLGAIALFVMGNGIGLPLIIMGTTEGKLLPKAGQWMHAIRIVFGIAFLGVAIYLLDKIIPVSLSLALWASLLIGCSIFLGALEPLHGSSSALEKLKKALGIAALIWGALLFIGASAGGTSVWQPLTTFSGGSGVAQTSNTPKAPFNYVKNLDELNRVTQASSEKPKLVDVYADWCTYCVKYDTKIFTQPQVAERLAKFDLYKVDITDDNADNQTMINALGVFLPPALIFYDRSGNELKSLRVIGEMNADELSAHLDKVLTQQ